MDSLTYAVSTKPYNVNFVRQKVIPLRVLLPADDQTFIYVDF